MIGAIKYQVDEATSLYLYAAGTYGKIDWDNAQNAATCLRKDVATNLVAQERYTFFPYRPDCKKEDALRIEEDIGADECILGLMETERYQLETDGGLSVQSFDFPNEDNKFLDIEKNRNSITFQFVNYLGRSRIFCKGMPILTFLVIPKKISYKNDYIPLTEAIAEHCAQLLLETTGVTTSRFSKQDDVTTENLFEQFIFLRQFCYSDNLRSLFAAIRRNPDRQLVSEEEFRPFGTGRPSRKFFARPFSYGRDWVRMSDGSCLPQQIAVQRKHDSLDTPANRFLKFAFLRFRELCEMLRKELNASPQKRAECGKEASAIQTILDDILQDAFFDDVGDMELLPQNNQVLERREGYAQIFRANAMLDLALQLHWPGGEDVYDGEAKNVALLYEYWVFFELHNIIHAMGDAVETEETEESFIKRKNGLMISLAQSRKSCQPFHLPKLHVHVDLYYNRAFCEKDFDAQSYAGSYSRKFRPDYTIAIYSDAYENERAALRDGAVSFLHFDAKYRLIRLLGKDDATEEALDKEKAEEVVHHYRQGDLMKMHTYRDAIRRTIGSYVIYPGDEEDTFSLYDEILPGVGAFVLKPSKSEAGEETLRKFLEDVIQYRAKNLPRLKLMMQAEESVIREPQDTLPYLAQTSTPPVSVSQDKFCIIGYLKHDYYYNHLTKDSPLTTRTEFLFYFHVIQGKTSAGKVYQFPDNIFRAEYFRFFVEDKSTKELPMMPIICTVDQKRGKLISRAELLEKLEESSGHTASYYYVVPVRVWQNVPPPNYGWHEFISANHNKLPKVIPFRRALP